jgi:hypothetical protein
VRKYREIDRANDRYHELVVDEATDEILHEDKGKLSDHEGHGSDRKRFEDEDV